MILFVTKSNKLPSIRPLNFRWRFKRYHLIAIKLACCQNIIPTHLLFKAMADQDLELRRGVGFVLLDLPTFLPSVISSFFSQS